MKILHLPFALLCGFSTIIRNAYAEEPEASCQDDLLYTYIDNDEIALTCGGIREVESTRQKLCQIEEVQMHCPFSCGLCCEDTENFFVNCEWIAMEDWRKVEYCGQTFEHRMVQEACPVACDYCYDNAIDATPVPTTALTAFPSSSPSPTYTQSPTVADIPIRFDGIKEVISIERGIIDLEWKEPILGDDFLPFNMSEIVYHVFVSAGEFNFTDALNSTDVLSLANFFQGEDGFQYSTTVNLSETISSTYYGIRHYLLVIAEAQGIFSRNTNAFSVSLSAVSPVIYSNVTIKGFFVPTDALDISMDGYDLKFTGALLDNHLDIQVGDFLTGMSSNEEIFVVTVLQVVSTETEKAHFLVYPSDPMNDLIEELQYSSEVIIYDEDEETSDDLQRRRELLKSTSFLARNNSGEYIFIGDKFTGVVNDSKFLISENETRSLRTYRKRLAHISRKFPANGKTFYVKFVSTTSLSIDIEKSWGRKSVTVRLTNTNTFSVVFTFSKSLSVQYPNPSKPLWKGAMIKKTIWIKLVPVRLDFQPFIDGSIKITAKLAVKGSVVWKVGASPFAKISNYDGLQYSSGIGKPKAPTVSLRENAAALEGAVDIISTLAFRVKARVYWDTFAVTLGASASFNIHAAAKQYIFFNPPATVIALDKLNVDIVFKIFLRGSSLFLRGKLFDVDLYVKTFPILQLPQESWSLPSQECLNEDEVQTAIVKFTTISEKKVTPLPWLTNTWVGKATWYAIGDFTDWLQNQPTRYGVELTIQLPPETEEAARVRGKIYAFIYPKIPGKSFLPVAYEKDLDIQSASCKKTEEPSLQPTMFPSQSPSLTLSSIPSNQPSQVPSKEPSRSPSANPTTSIKPSPSPTASPSNCPSEPQSDLGWWSGMFGDPHISSFNRLRFDCQAAGRFITATSLESPAFMVQERFTAVGSTSTVCSRASVSTAFVIKDENVPTVQVSTPRYGYNSTLNMMGSCPIDFAVDGEANLINEDHGPDLIVSRSGSFIRIMHKCTGIIVQARVRNSQSFGCFFLVQVFIPHNYRVGETILGLLGTPNLSRSDDWRARNGAILPIPISQNGRTFSEAYNYCTTNWCIRDEVESIFTYIHEGESFEGITSCDEEYFDDLEVAITSPPAELVNVCGENLACLVDGICGDLEDAKDVLKDEEIIDVQCPTDAGRGSGGFGDPHIFTFDRLLFDCQAAGEFITVTSLESPEFMIQERFTAVGSSSTSCSQASASTGFAIADVNVPTVQVSTPRHGTSSTTLNMIDSCPIDVYVNGIAVRIEDDHGPDIRIRSWGSFIRVTHSSSGVIVQARVRDSPSFGCVFLTQVFLPSTYRVGETILGLLGTPNDSITDDWRARDGTILSIPGSQLARTFSEAYNYCTTNWCIRDEDESLFTYGHEGETFSGISLCDSPYVNDLEIAIANPSVELASVCGENLVCLVDGICGDLEDAENVLQDEKIIDCFDPLDIPEEPSSIPSDSPSTLPSESPSSEPSRLPSISPTPRPTPEPTEAPTKAPTSAPTATPTKSPTPMPTNTPTKTPSRQPSPQPSPFPTSRPSTEPSDSPSKIPSDVPSDSPSGPTSIPSKSPTLRPTLSVKPSPFPSPAPFAPTSQPTKTPTKNPSPRPSSCDPEADQVFSYTRQNGITQTDMCAWVASSTIRIERFCGQHNLASAEVFANCPATCSTMYSNANPCRDMPGYTFDAINSDDTYTCGFLTQSPDQNVNLIRKERYCQPELQLTACAWSCGVCEKALC
ncbi:hypothetical protein CTEN210_06818 [Chaetoceros tenuissimus]|uniref:Circumsporozoite protein n=1 Tax=Chaetoceros tenuissimus TaxID=426638 RepID=A0AAD3H4J7_9STRA|nr:hypothetical protein CTEN210_06818 [Chaetoceros tenuissimus]